MEPLLVVSADSHAGAPWADYRPHLDPALRDEFDRWLADRSQGDPLAGSPLGGDLYAKEYVDAFRAHEAVTGGGLEGAWDPERRLREMDAQGVAAEVVFPDWQNRNAPPFGALEAPGSCDPELQRAGARAYNRWLAGFCGHAPERLAGVALVTLGDVAATVEEIEWAQRAGLRGGILFPTLPDDTELPWYGDPTYEPIWEACAALHLPVHTRPGGATSEYGELPGSPLLYWYERSVFSRRIFAFLLFDGVFERHPQLRLVFVDQGSRWVAEKLASLDYRYEGPQFRGRDEGLSFKPSEYWARNCLVTAMAMDRSECDERQRVGVHRMMWGSNYPQIEGSWPGTREALRDVFCGVPEAEARAILGGTAARLYGLDEGTLAAVAREIGPSADLLRPAA